MVPPHRGLPRAPVAPSTRSGEPSNLLLVMTSHSHVPAGEGHVYTCPFLWGDLVSG